MDIMKQVQESLNSLKRLTPNGKEYWSARDLMAPLGYTRWEKFEHVIKKAIMACESAGVDSSDQFHPTVNMIIAGKGAKLKRADYLVSRFAAYLIAMNGNPKLPQIATAQNYFAVQTRRQEIAEQTTNTENRLESRSRIKIANRHLGDAARDSGVQNYALFHDAGYRGLYEMGLKDIREKKGLAPKEDILDRSGRAELAANEFRITQTEEALKRDKIVGDSNARETHKKVGKAVRTTIAKLGGTMPEDLPAEQSIKLLAAEKRKQKRIDNKKTLRITKRERNEED